MAAEVYKYRVWCNTDSKWEYVWAEVEPTVCPVDTAHPIDTAKTAVVSTKGSPALDSEGRMKKSPDKEAADKGVKYMNGNEAKLVATLGTTTTFDLTLAEDIELIGVLLWVGSDALVGDSVKLEVMSGATPVGDFGPEFWVVPGQHQVFQEEITKKDLVTGLKLRLTYTSTGGVDVPLVLNYKYRV